MTKQTLQTWTMLALRFLSVVALVFVAFAHKPVEVQLTSDFELASYQLPDGSYAVICISDHGDSHGKHDKHLQNTGCEACRISASFICPMPTASTGAAPQLAFAYQLAPAQPILTRNSYPPSAPPQAPPLA